MQFILMPYWPHSTPKDLKRKPNLRHCLDKTRKMNDKYGSPFHTFSIYDWFQTRSAKCFLRKWSLNLTQNVCTRSFKCGWLQRNLVGAVSTLVPSICKADIVIRSLRKAEPANKVSLLYHFPLQTIFICKLVAISHFFPLHKKLSCCSFAGSLHEFLIVSRKVIARSGRL